MLRTVPLGECHIFLRLNSFTRASSGAIAAHLTPAPTFLFISAASMVIWSLVVAFLDAEIVREQVNIQVGMNSGLSLMSCQIMRGISSPSISTTGFATLIFAISDKTFLQVARTETLVRSASCVYREPYPY